MVSLYNRASPIQRKMLRAIEGAMINAMHAHPEEAEISPRFRRSIAKRAVGTLSALLPEVLAEASSPRSDMDGDDMVIPCLAPSQPFMGAQTAAGCCNDGVGPHHISDGEDVEEGVAVGTAPSFSRLTSENRFPTFVSSVVEKSTSAFKHWSRQWVNFMK